MPRIFISHSSKDNDLAMELCQALRSDSVDVTQCEPVVDFEHLVDYDILVDSELAPGKPWPKQLHEWMAHCHAAILLLTKNAVKSRWVLKEATILAWRQSLDSAFRLFVVRYPNVTDADLSEAGFDPLTLGEIQQLTGADLGEIALQVRTSAAALQAGPTPYDSLFAALEDLAADIKPNALRRLAEKLHVQPPQWRPDLDTRHQYVQAIAQQLLNEQLGDVADLVDVLLNGAPTEVVEKILYILAPQWVDAEAAGRLPIFSSCSSRRAIAMNGSEVAAFTAEMYVRRAHPLSRRQQVLHVAGGNSGDLVEHVTRELSWLMQRDFSRPSKSLASDELDLVIKHYAKGKPRYYVVLPSPHYADDIRSLMARFPKLTFILWTGEDLIDYGLESIVGLTPPVDLRTEQMQMESYSEAREMLARL